MLQSFRDNLKGTVATILVTLMIIPFALFGVDSLFIQNGSPNEAASVNGEVITEQEVRQAIFLQKQQMLSRFGDRIPADFLSDERLREPVLNGLIERRALVQEAEETGMAISDLALDEEIVSAPQFQQDGVFSRERYQQLLRSMGYTAVGYKQLLEREMLLTQQASGISGSSFVTPAELARSAALSQQKRSFYYMTLPLSATDKQTVSAAEIESYYSENENRFIAPEQVAIEYIDVTSADLVADLEFTEEQLRQQYQQEIAAFERKTERRAAHILIEPKDDQSERAIAESIKQRLDAGEDFAALAAELSEDPISKEQGGDLGFTAGDIFPEAFEAALASLTTGEVSDIVETDAGLHIIKLLEEQVSQPPTFEEQRMSIAQALKDAEADSLFVELLGRLGDLTYNASSLEDAAEELGLSVGRSELFDVNGGEGLAALPEVVAAAFSSELKEEGNTSEVLELADDRSAVIRVVEHQPTHTKALSLVRDEIVSAVQRQKAQEALAEQAAELEQRVRDGEEIEALAKASDLEWQVSLGAIRTDAKVDQSILQHVFSLLRPQGEPVVSGFHLPGGDYVIVSLTKVEDGTLESLAKEQQNGLAYSLARTAGMNDYAAYQAMVHSRAEVERR